MTEKKETQNTPEGNVQIGSNGQEPAAEGLRMTFDPMTIEHLGVRMYSTLPPVLAELVANAYDADAGKVEITLDDAGEKQIIVKDDGIGMTFGEINGKFLRIGRNRRAEEGDGVTAKGRKTIGKKGLGKLAFFGIAHEITISTRKNGKKNVFTMDWEKIKTSASSDYEPTIVKKEEPCPAEANGTEVTLRKIQRESDFSAEELANSLSKIFILDSDFKVSIQHNSENPIELDNERKYSGLVKEVEWRIPEDGVFESEYPRRAEITGKLFATKKPIPPKSNMRGVTLFSRKKLVNIPEYFSDSTSSHFFSYLTGWLMVDFIDDLPDDVIATNRQSLNWGHPEMIELRSYLRSLLNWLEQDWRIKRADAREQELAQKTGINVPDWFSKLPPEVRTLVEPILQAVVKESELPTETISSAAMKLHEIVPEYPRFHWRHLHPEVQAVSKQYYISKDYYTAFFESVKKYVNAVKTKSGSALTDNALLENVFASVNPKLSVTDRFKKPNGANFDPDTIGNITRGHRMLVLGIWQACRGPIAHEEVCDLRDSGLFTEKDCLDALSLLSHLFYRLDNSNLVT